MKHATLAVLSAEIGHTRRQVFEYEYCLTVYVFAQPTMFAYADALDLLIFCLPARPLNGLLFSPQPPSLASHAMVCVQQQGRMSG